MRKLILGFLGIAYINTQCAEPNLQIGNLCISEGKAQQCHDHMDSLSAAIEENPNISNVCEDEVVDNVQRYNFIVSYENGYEHDPSCNTQTITFENTPLNEGPADLDEWQYNPISKQITFSVLHDDLVDRFGCIMVPSDEEYVWQCMMNLDILFGGYTQLTYSFHITIVLSRVYENQLDITVTKNEVVGDCCENVLQIQTILKFCEDFTCASYLDDGLTVRRKDDIYVEHSITSPEFDYYFLHGLQIKLGPFVPEILRTNGQQAGRLIYHFQSNIAMPDMILEAISKISETPQTDVDNTRRMLAEESAIGDDYKIKATGNISVDDYLEKEKEVEKVQESNNVLIGVSAGLGVLVLFSFVGILAYCLKVKSAKQNQLKKYEESQSAGVVTNESQA